MHSPVAVSTDLPRYSHRAFPPYAYVPGGAHPHPTRDPDGHSHDREETPIEDFDPDRWLECEPYLFGVDLFNHGYWWEAHEALEAVWIAAGRQSAAGQFVQGLILIAVAQLKRFQGFEDVARRMAEDGTSRMGGVGGQFMGLDVIALRHQVRDAFASGSRVRLALRAGGAD